LKTESDHIRVTHRLRGTSVTQLKPTKETNIMNTTTKTIILTLIIVSAAMMAGCLSNESSKEGNIHEDMTQLEAILTDPNYSDEEKYAAFAAVGEKYGAEIENHELESEVDSIPTPNMPKYQIQYSLMDSSGDPLAGIGWFTIVISGVLEYDQQICDFNKLALIGHRLSHLLTYSLFL